MLDIRGTTTIEALVALVIFAIGALGAAGTTVASLRAGNMGDHATHAGRLVEAAADRLAALAAEAGSSCAGLSPGTITSAHGETMRWWFIGAPKGLEVSFEISYSASSRQHVDTIWTFMRCR
jgi:type II secretory pathway pseudopilin PulG